MTMKFNLLGILFMAVAIWIGTMLGDVIGSIFGLAGGLIGTFISGVVIYFVYMMIAGGGKWSLMGAVMFSVFVFIAQLLNTWITSSFGIVEGFLSYLTMAVILSLMWGYFGKSGKAKSPISLKGR
jgi:hypothetical protein